MGAFKIPILIQILYNFFNCGLDRMVRNFDENIIKKVIINSCMYETVFTKHWTNNLAARVAQWLERRAQRSNDPCVGGSNPTVVRGCRFFGCNRINRGPVSQ
jgi:hypothetical protein